MPEPQDGHAARKEAIDAVRPLVTAEETRSTNLNARALGVISASSVVTAIAAFFAKDVLGGSSLEKLGDARTAAIVLLIVAVALLACTVLSGVRTLWPGTRLFIQPDGLAAWAAGDAIADEATVRHQTLRDLAGVLTGLREFNTEKVRRLKTTYTLYALAVAAIAIDAGIFFAAAV